MDEILGCYYLHTNGDLIFKPAAAFMNTTPVDYFDSDFVVKWWLLPATSPTGSLEGDVKWSMDWMREAFVLSSNKGKTAEALARICETNGWPPMILDAIVNNKRVVTLHSTSSDPNDPNQISPCIAIQVIEGEPYA